MLKITPPMNALEKFYLLAFLVGLVLFCFVISWGITTTEDRYAAKAEKVWGARR